MGRVDGGAVLYSMLGQGYSLRRPTNIDICSSLYVPSIFLRLEL
jgi:hypothetical protein